MWKSTDKLSEYIKALDIRNYPFDYTNRIIKNINGKSISLKNDKWAWHFHIKVTNSCNAKCNFCVEQNSTTKENSIKLLHNAGCLIDELKKNDVLFSVSVTGGEPTIYSKFKELSSMLNTKNIPFLSMNTNGSYLRKQINNIANIFGFVDISRHAIDDNENYQIFKTKAVPTLQEIRNIKLSGELGKTKLRVQSVVHNKTTIDDFKRMVEAYSFADDVSFRRLMILDDTYGIKYNNNADNYYNLIDFCIKNGTLEFQAIQDFYTYECWNIYGVHVHFSYSDMAKVLEMEKQESENIIREFICHPNGVIAGSWNGKDKIIYP